MLAGAGANSVSGDPTMRGTWRGEAHMRGTTDNGAMARDKQGRRDGSMGATHLNRLACSSVFSLLGAAARREPLEEERWRLEVLAASAPGLPLAL